VHGNGKASVTASAQFIVNYQRSFSAMGFFFWFVGRIKRQPACAISFPGRIKYQGRRFETSARRGRQGVRSIGSMAASVRPRKREPPPRCRQSAGTEAERARSGFSIYQIYVSNY
jgi:hypothetical protein